MGTPDKDYQEELPVRFDFTTALQGEDITSFEVTAIVANGGDATPSSFLKDSALKIGSYIDQWIKGGVINTKYHIRCLVTTSSGRKLVGSGYIKVIKR